MHDLDIPEVLAAHSLGHSGQASSAPGGQPGSDHTGQHARRGTGKNSRGKEALESLLPFSFLSQVPCWNHNMQLLYINTLLPSRHIQGEELCFQAHCT